MPGFIELRGNALDAITGERVFPGGKMFDTGIIRRRRTIPSKTILLKEETIVWLAEEAGLKICGGNCDCKSVERVSKSAPVVEREDAGVGDGEGSVGKAKVGGKPAAKRRASGSTKGK